MKWQLTGWFSLSVFNSPKTSCHLQTCFCRNYNKKVCFLTINTTRVILIPHKPWSPNFLYFTFIWGKTHFTVKRSKAAQVFISKLEPFKVNTKCINSAVTKCHNLSSGIVKKTTREVSRNVTFFIIHLQKLKLPYLLSFWHVVNLQSFSLCVNQIFFNRR